MWESTGKYINDLTELSASVMGEKHDCTIVCQALKERIRLDYAARNHDKNTAASVDNLKMSIDDASEALEKLRHLSPRKLELGQLTEFWMAASSTYTAALKRLEPNSPEATDLQGLILSTCDQVEVDTWPGLPSLKHNYLAVLFSLPDLESHRKGVEIGLSEILPLRRMQYQLAGDRQVRHTLQVILSGLTRLVHEDPAARWNVKLDEVLREMAQTSLIQSIFAGHQIIDADTEGNAVYRTLAAIVIQLEHHQTPSIPKRDIDILYRRLNDFYRNESKGTLAVPGSDVGNLLRRLERSTGIVADASDSL